MTFQPIGRAAAAIVDRLAAKRGARPGVEVLRPASREEWLALRRQNVGASVAGCLLGVHEYQTAFGLWALRTGRVADDPEETAPMRRGRLLEGPALQLVQEERPDWQVTPNPMPGGLYFVDRALRLGATPDAFVECPERGRGVLQVKSVEPSIFRKKWRGEDGEVTPPLWIAVQAIVEADLVGADWAAVAAMRVGFGLELDIMPVPLHPGVVDRVRQAVAEFWALVESGRTPDFDYGRDADLIAEIYGEDDGGEVDLSGENMLPAMSDEDARLAEEIKERIARRKEIQAELLAKMQHAARATYNGSLFATAKTVKRSAYEVAATSYRDIRFKRSA